MPGDAGLGSSNRESLTQCIRMEVPTGCRFTSERSTSPRISARLAAGDYASATEKMGLHDRDRLLLT